MHFRRAPIDWVMNYYTELTGWQVELDSSITGSFTMLPTRQMTEAEIVKRIEQILAGQGIVLEKKSESVLKATRWEPPSIRQPPNKPTAQQNKPEPVDVLSKRPLDLVLEAYADLSRKRVERVDGVQAAISLKTTNEIPFAEALVLIESELKKYNIGLFEIQTNRLVAAWIEPDKVVTPDKPENITSDVPEIKSYRERYQERLKQRKEILERRGRAGAETNAAMMTKEEVEQHMKDYQMDLIRAGGELGPPLPISLTGKWMINSSRKASCLRVKTLTKYGKHPTRSGRRRINPRLSSVVLVSKGNGMKCLLFLVLCSAMLFCFLDAHRYLWNPNRVNQTHGLTSMSLTRATHTMVTLRRCQGLYTPD